MKTIVINLRVNGRWHQLAVHPGDLLVNVLRDRLGLTGTKIGCQEGECGACTVNIDGKAVLSCMILAVQADGCDIQTIEGLQNGASLHPIQETFISESAVQCGFCTPGMIMAAHALITSESDPSETVVRTHLANSLCRCTGYDKPVKAVLKAAMEIREKANE